MKHTKKAAAVCAAALTLTLSLTGCNPLRFVFPFGGQPQETTAPATLQAVTTVPPATAVPTVAPTTAVPVTQAPATEKPTDAPKTEQSSQQNSPKATSEKTLGGARLVETPDYTDDVLGVTFHIPEWQNRVYAKTDNYDGKYSLTFYEGSNLARGLEDGYDGMGMLFTLYEDSAQASGDITYPVGTIEIGGEKVYLTYFKPTDVRFYPEGSLQENYQEMYKHQREYFETGVFRSAMHYQPSASTYAVNLTSE